MSGLVVKTTGSATTAPPEAPIANDGFFPDVPPAVTRDQYRIRDNVTPARLRKALVGAIITVGNQLGAFRDEQMAAGHATLAAVPAPQIDGQSRFELLYARAVGAYAKAELVEAYRDIDTTTAGQRQAEEMEPSIVELRRDALHAIRDILGRPRMRSELI
ncbi:MAG TPA: head completion/stabilization protein [Sphingomonas sp.]|nr:head completion/stabilization protein [Sphingomonas sp.]